MNKVIAGTANAPYFRHSDIDGMYKLRGEVFKERLNWDVKTINGREIDDFDNLNPIYLLSRNNYRHIEGCLRLLPTTNPYMLEKVFPELLRGETIPKDENIWEWSRFAVLPIDEHDVAQGNLNEVTVGIFRSAYEFAIQHDIQKYVAVTSVAAERLLKQLKLPIQRFGDGKATRVGKVLSVAVWVDINDQYKEAVQTFNPTNHSERHIAA